MTLTKIITQSQPESWLLIAVTYDIIERTWEQIVSVKAYDPWQKVYIDITYIAVEKMNIEQVCNNIDWYEEYRESKAA